MLNINLSPIYMFAFANVLCLGNAVLKTQLIEDLCFTSNSAVIHTKYEKSGILMSIPRYSLDKDFNCEVIIIPEMYRTLVLSIYRYELSDNDQLTIEDSDRHKIGLIGYGIFKNEKKSITSNGKIVIHYKKSNSSFYNPRAGFQFTYTELQDPPCLTNEFKCKNDKCILMSLACDGHNHCGDNSDEVKCKPGVSEDSNLKVGISRQISNTSIAWVSTIIVAGIILLIVIIVFIVVLVRRAKLKKSNPPQQQLNQPNRHIPLQSVSSTVQPAQAENVNGIPGMADNGQPRQTFYNRMRQSFRRQPTHNVTEVPVSQEVISVPSMYPSLEQIPPSAPDLNGADNPNFKSDE